jgi:nicotinamidase-related amidase
MKTLPKTAVLLLVDLQQGFDDPRWGRRNNPQMEARVADLLGAFRASKRRVMHAKHMSATVASPLRPGQPGNHFKVRLAPAPGELVVEKRVNSSFIGTSLEKILRRDGHDTLVIAGLTTNHCVSTTARMAGNLGFNVWVVSDATATFDRAGPDGVEHTAEEIQAIALSDLHGEFATVVDTNAVLSAVQPRAASMRKPAATMPEPASRRHRAC